MPREKVLQFVEARAKLSEIVDRVSERGETFVVAKRQKPVAAIIGIAKYREMIGATKYLRSRGGKTIFKIGGIGRATSDVDDAIDELRKSRLEALTRSFSRDVRD